MAKTNRKSQRGEGECRLRCSSWAVFHETFNDCLALKRRVLAFLFEVSSNTVGGQPDKHKQRGTAVCLCVLVRKLLTRPRLRQEGQSVLGPFV